MFLEGNSSRNIKSMCFVDYANYLYRKEDIDKAITSYNKAIFLNKDNSYAYGGLAVALVKNKSYIQALDCCKKALEIKPDDRLFLLLIISYKSIGETELAENTLKESLKYFGNDLSSVYDRLSYTYWYYNMFEDAEYYSKEAIKLNPNDPKPHYHLAAVYSAKKQYQMAIKEFQKVIVLQPDKQYKKSAQKEMEKIVKYISEIK
jgi:tetratricopeptide (TPR) repeat protein